MSSLRVDKNGRRFFQRESWKFLKLIGRENGRRGVDSVAGGGEGSGFLTNFKIDVGTGEIVGNNSRSHGGPHTRSRMNPWRVLTSGTKVLYIYIYLYIPRGTLR